MENCGRFVKLKYINAKEKKGSFLLCRNSRIGRVSETHVETRGSRARDYLVR